MCKKIEAKPFLCKIFKWGIEIVVLFFPPLKHSHCHDRWKTAADQMVCLCICLCLCIWD